ncbi:MAG: response regulator [Bacteroidia bacterium]|nr:response regulator [Bacteroidia bacterium]
MNFIKAIIIDDEEHNRNVLMALLTKHCQLIKVIAVCANVDDGYSEIVNQKPQIVFLDIKMPNKNGFELLKLFSQIDFEVIFVSAFNEYAITAFEFNALGYILKPIDYLKLITVVDKAIAKISEKSVNENVFNFIKTIEDENEIINKIVVHHNFKVFFVKIEEIISVESKKDVSELKLVDGSVYYSTKNLKLFEGLFIHFKGFIRINKGVIINTSYVKSYSKGDVCILEMVNNASYDVSRRKKTEVLNQIKLLNF